jgi:hypothetical protein
MGNINDSADFPDRGRRFPISITYLLVVAKQQFGLGDCFPPISMQFASVIERRDPSRHSLNLSQQYSNRSEDMDVIASLNMLYQAQTDEMGM